MSYCSISSSCPCALHSTVMRAVPHSTDAQKRKTYCRFKSAFGLWPCSKLNIATLQSSGHQCYPMGAPRPLTSCKFLSHRHQALQYECCTTQYCMHAVLHSTCTVLHACRTAQLCAQPYTAHSCPYLGTKFYRTPLYADDHILHSTVWRRVPLMTPLISASAQSDCLTWSPESRYV